MKKIISILLIFAFLVQCSSQLWIVAAFKLNQDYIAANLCINRFEAIPVCKGSCYLEDQLNHHQQQDQKFPDLKTKEVNLFCQDLQSLFPEILSITAEESTFPVYDAGINGSDFLQGVFHPPCSVS